MKRIALVTALAALAAPVSALAENSSRAAPGFANLRSSTVQSRPVGEFGAWREYLMRLQAFRKKRQSDDGEGSDLDDGRRAPASRKR